MDSRKSLAWLVAEKLPLFALALASCVITLLAQSKARAVASLEVYSLATRLSNALVSDMTYLLTVLWPGGLSAFYPFPAAGVPMWQTIAAGVVLAGLTVAALALGRRKPYLPVGWLWYQGTLVPVIGLVQVGTQAMADRYTYVPLIGIFVLFAWGLGDLVFRWPASRTVAVSATIVLVGAAAAASWVQVGYWHDSLTLWKHAVEVDPANYVALDYLGCALRDNKELAEARRYHEQALAINPRYADAHNNLGFLFDHEGKINEAIGHYSKAIDLAPNHLLALYNLANDLKRSGKTEQALLHYKRALELDPNSARVHHNLGQLFAERGKTAEALDHLSAAVRIRPDYAMAHYHLGLALLSNGQPADAVVHLREALRLDPRYTKARYRLALALDRLGKKQESQSCLQDAVRMDRDWPQAFAEMAWSLATDSDPSTRNAAFAVGLAEQACQATGYERPAFLDALAAAYAEAGRFDEAQTTEQKAINLLGAADEARLLPMKARLSLYAGRRPFRTKSGEQ